jgi:NDP-sugar pyrophosphorylase family protein
LPIDGYWTDIGNPGDYLQANMDYLAGRIRMEGLGKHVDGCLHAESAVTNGACLTECVIGDDVTLPHGTTLTNCVVWPGTTLAEPMTLQSAILTPYGIYQVEGKTAQPIALEV